MRGELFRIGPLCASSSGKHIVRLLAPIRPMLSVADSLVSTLLALIFVHAAHPDRRSQRGDAAQFVCLHPTDCGLNLRVRTAVDGQVGAGYIGGLRAGDERDHCSDFLWFSVAPECGVSDLWDSPVA